VIEGPSKNPHFVISSGGRNLLSRDLSIYFEEKGAVAPRGYGGYRPGLIDRPYHKVWYLCLRTWHLWPEIFVILTVYLLSFYIADLYNFESSFLSAAYLFRFFIAYFTATGIMMAIDFWPPFQPGTGRLCDHFIPHSALRVPLATLHRPCLSSPHEGSQTTGPHYRRRQVGA